MSNNMMPNRHVPCQECGEAIHMDANYCGYCGEKREGISKEGDAAVPSDRLRHTRTVPPASRGFKMNDAEIDCAGEEYHRDAPDPVYREYQSPEAVDTPRIRLGVEACRKLGLSVGGKYRLEPHEDGILVTTESSRSASRGEPDE